MKTIIYTFADGHKEELEVTDEVAEFVGKQTLK